MGKVLILLSIENKKQAVTIYLSMYILLTLPYIILKKQKLQLTTTQIYLSLNEISKISLVDQSDGRNHSCNHPAEDSKMGHTGYSGSWLGSPQGCLQACALGGFHRTHRILGGWDRRFGALEIAVLEKGGLLGVQAGSTHFGALQAHTRLGGQPLRGPGRRPAGNLPSPLEAGAWALECPGTKYEKCGVCTPAPVHNQHGTRTGE